MSIDQNETTKVSPAPSRSRWAQLGASLLLLLQSACSSADDPPAGKVEHGPFEVVVGVRRISTGNFWQGGGFFDKRGVSEFQLRWRGKTVVTPGGNGKFWRVLRLDGAPRPAVLLVTSDFVLVSEDAAGKLQFTPINSHSSDLAELQWLDSVDGQPGPSVTYGVEAITDLQADTRLAGGRWMRLGSRGVFDVGTLTTYKVDPWVPMVPGVPITSISREGDEVRAFSPGRTQYVLAANGIDYARGNGSHAHGLLVVDIATGITTELRADRQRFRFAEPADVNAAWVHHHFSWQREGSGPERLVPRESFKPWPWHAKMSSHHPGQWLLSVERIDVPFFEVVRRLLKAEPGVVMSDPPDKSGYGQTFSLGGCALQVMAFGGGAQFADSNRLFISPVDRKFAPDSAQCVAAMQHLRRVIDAELATGRHDALLLLD